MAKKEKTKVKSLEEILFDCRNLLRGRASMADKRDMLLTLVFLRFTNDRFEKRREELKEELKRRDINEASPFFDSMLERPSSYKEVIYLQDDCRWSVIENAETSKYPITLDEIIYKLESRNPHKLKGALPQQIFTSSGIPANTIKQVVDEVAKIREKSFPEIKDLIGRVYEYFLQSFAVNSEKEEGEFYTPHSIVELLAALIEPYDGTIYDPCCGSGGMLVQGAKVVEAHGGNVKDVTVYGQEIQPETYRLTKMNMAVRGIECKLGDMPASTFTHDQHPGIKVDYVMANPPFNLKKWRDSKELLTDYRWKIDNEGDYLVPPESNANYAWILHILSKLNPRTGIAGFLLSNGALGDMDTLNIRRELIKKDKVEAIIILPRNMFYSTDISVTVWILNQNKKGRDWHERKLRNRTGEILFIDLRTWNDQIYMKKYVKFEPERIKEIAAIYHNWQIEGTDGRNYAKPELYRSVSIDEISSEENNWSLVPSRYIEFVDRDQFLDYESIMKDSADVIKGLLDEQKQNDSDLRKAFEVLGYKMN